MIYTISDGDLTVKINSFGAETVSVVYKGKERIWQNDNGSWAHFAPVLFPVCGRTKVKVNGKNYDTGFHGFARNREFSVVQEDGRSVKFDLCSDPSLKEIYPFDFVFSIIYSVSGNSLTIKYSVENRGKDEMYFSCGAHDSFSLSGELSDYSLEFEKAENFLSLLHTDKGRLNGKTKDFGKGKTLVLPEKYLTKGKTVIFGGLNSRRLSLFGKNDGKILEMEFPDFGNLLLWRPEGAKMICIEPWMNLPDFKYEKRELSEKKGIIKLASGKTKTFERKNKYY